MKKNDVLDYHAFPTPGKLQIASKKPLENAHDLTLAYSPGVGEPCSAIAKDPRAVYRYTSKGNLVGVISNGTAVLGLGDIGPEAAKPVMEGKALLMKLLAGVDAFDLEIAEKDPERLAGIIKSLAPTFGGINLEDIKSPDCFQLEESLQASVPIPVMHDDQHSTAIVVAAALKNALRLVKKEFKSLRVVVYGAGAGAIASTKLLKTMGVLPSNIVMFDSRGLLHKNRVDLPAHKVPFATERPISSLSEAMVKADFFLGLSVANVLKPAHLLSMASNPIVFALANPEPEIDHALALATRDDIILATGRGDYPNQVNNVLAFPFIFRGLLDVHATGLNNRIKQAAVEAIASVVHAPPGAFEGNLPAFGKEFLIPEPLDSRLLTTVATAVAKAAMDTGVAQRPIADWKAYHEELLAHIM